MAAVFAVLGVNVTMLLFMGISILMTLLLVSALVLQWRNDKINAFMSSMPGPIPIPFIGTAYKLIGFKLENFCDFLIHHTKEYPKTAAHWLLGRPILITGDLEIINAILASNHSIEKTPEYAFFDKGCAGLFSASGHNWRSMRKALIPGFKTNVQGVSFADNYSYHLSIFVEALQKYADDGKEHDVFPTIHSCVLDIVSDNMFDTRMGIQTRNQNIAHVSKVATEMIFERVCNPLLRPNWVYSLLGKQQKLDELINTGNCFLQKVLDERVKIRNQLKEMNPMFERPQTYVETLLSNVDLGVISKTHALEEIKEIVVAGGLTTAAAVGNTLWLLSMFPDVQKRAYREVIETCNGNEVTLDDLPKLVYVEMVCKEMLRHFGPPFVGRHLVQDLKVNDKMTIPAGVRVVLGTWLLHHNPEFWEEPEKFNPEHFSEVSVKTRPKGAFVPFLSGPRNCPGNKHAMQSIKILVAATLLHYELSSKKAPPQDFSIEKCRLLFLLRPFGGHLVQMKSRRPRTADAVFK